MGKGRFDFKGKLSQVSLEALDEKLNIVRKYQVYLLAAGVGVLLFQLFFYVTLPQIKAYNKTREMRARYTELITSKEKTLAEKERIQEEFDMLNDELDDKMSEFFEVAEVEEFLLYILPKLAQKHQVRLTAVKFRPAQSRGKGMRYHPLALKANASFGSLMQFFYELEQYSKTIKLSQVKVNRIGVDPVVLSTSLTLELYSLMGQP